MDELPESPEQLRDSLNSLFSDDSQFDSPDGTLDILSQREMVMSKAVSKNIACGTQGQRRVSAPASSTSKLVAGDSSPPPGSESQQASDTASAAQWIDKVQASEEVRSRRRQACRTMMDHLEAYVPEVCNLEAVDRVHVVNKLEVEVDRLQQNMARVVHSQVRCGFEELDVKRKQLTEMEEKMGRMNKTYLKELSEHRDHDRIRTEGFQKAIEALDRKGTQLYDAFEFMSEELRSTVMIVLEEKLKAIFSHDPSLKEGQNELEVAKFEDSLIRDKLVALELTNTKTREELRQERQRMKKAEASLEKANWELSESEVHMWRLAKEKNSREFEDVNTQTDDVIQDSRDFAERDTQTDNVIRDSRGVAEVDTQTDVVGQGVEKCDQGKDLSGPPSKCKDQDQMFRWKEQEQALASKRQKNGIEVSFGSFGSFDKMALEESHEELLKKAQRETMACRETIQQRDATIERLQMDLPEQSQKSLELSDAEGKAIAAVTEGCSGMPPMTLHAELRAVMDLREEDQKQNALDIENFESLVKQLQHEARLAQEASQATQEEGERVTRSLIPGDMAESFDAEVRTRKILEQQVEEFKAACAMMLSRNATLEAALLALEPGSSSSSDEKSVACRVATANQEWQGNEKKKQLNEKVTVQKAQMQSVVMENTVMHMALSELQTEVQRLSRELRKGLPDSPETTSGDLEAVLARMEKVARQGGGAYVRLHKEAQLRQIAKDQRPEGNTKELKQDHKVIPQFGAECSTVSRHAASASPATSPPPQQHMHQHTISLPPTHQAVN